MSLKDHTSKLINNHRSQILHSKNFDIFWLGQKSAHKLPDSAMLPYTPNATLQEFDVTVADASDDSSEDENDVEEATYGNLEPSQYAQEDTKKRKRSNSFRRVSITRPLREDASFDSSGIDPRSAELDSDGAGLADVNEPLDTTYSSKSKKRQGGGKPASTKKKPTTHRARADLKALAPAGTEPGISTIQGFVPNNTPTAVAPAKATKAKKVTTPRVKRAPELTTKAKAAAAIAEASMEQNAQNPVPAQPQLLPVSNGAMDPMLEKNTIVAAADGVSGAEEHQSLFGGGNPVLLESKPGPGHDFAIQVAEEAVKLAARTSGQLS